MLSTATRPRRPRLHLLAIVCLLFLAASDLSGQELRGTLVGRIADTSSGVVSAATVVATNQDTNVAVRAVSNAEGNYQIPLLNPGVYTISVEMTGFKTFQRKNIEVRIGDRI